MLVAVILMLIIRIKFDIKPTEILIFIFMTFVIDKIFFYVGKYRELRRERERFELIIQKIEDNLKCQKDIR